LAEVDLDPQVAAGALVLNLPDEQYAVWFRPEVVHEVNWGGDPHNKEIAISEGDGVRLSPRKSFDLWRELVDQHCQQWTLTETEAAAAFATPPRRVALPPHAGRVADG
jgi:chemotaxis family two-component system sensor kinase Cph1